MADLQAEITVNIAGRPYLIAISCEKSVVKDLCVTAVTLYGIYKTHKLLELAIEGIVNRRLGGSTLDQGTVCVCIWRLLYIKQFSVFKF